VPAQRGGGFSGFQPRAAAGARAGIRGHRRRAWSALCKICWLPAARCSASASCLQRTVSDPIEFETGFDGRAQWESLLRGIAAEPPAALDGLAPANVSATSGPARLSAQLAAAMPGRDSLVGQHTVPGLVSGAAWSST